MIELKNCKICGKEVIPEKKITKRNNNTLYVFKIDHDCKPGFRIHHLSFFLQNDTPEKKCIESLDDSEEFYSGIWNKYMGVEE